MTVKWHQGELDLLQVADWENVTVPSIGQVDKAGEMLFFNMA